MLLLIFIFCMINGHSVHFKQKYLTLFPPALWFVPTAWNPPRGPKALSKVVNVFHWVKSFISFSVRNVNLRCHGPNSDRIVRNTNILIRSKTLRDIWHLILISLAYNLTPSRNCAILMYKLSTFYSSAAFEKGKGVYSFVTYRLG